MNKNLYPYTLIHCALLCEAQVFIEYFKLKKINSNPKIYINDTFIIVISGVGEINTIKALEYCFTTYNISRALNIGIAGSKNKNFKIGTLFCTNKILDDISYSTLYTSDNIVEYKDKQDEVLYDMEAKYFYEITKKYLDEDEIFIFKVVSDYLQKDILRKDFIKSLIFKNRTKIVKYIQK